MNLVKLLSVGQSLDGKKSALGKYKLPRQMVMPKFGSTVKPSKPSVLKQTENLETPVVIETAAPELPIVQKSIFAQPKSSTVSAKLEKTQKIPAGTILKRVEEPVAISQHPSLASRIKTKIAGVKKVLFPVRSRRKAGAAPVQTEWALEKVRVERNDLTDADLEIVTPKIPALKQNSKSSLPELNYAKNFGQAWIKMTKHLFKTTSPFEKQSAEKVFAPEKIVDQPESELAGRI